MEFCPSELEVKHDIPSIPLSDLIPASLARVVPETGPSALSSTLISKLTRSKVARTRIQLTQP